MIKFIRRITVFTISLILILFVIASVIYYNFTAIKNKSESEFENISYYDCLLMGDSQIQRIDPNLFSFRTFNFASSGEHYYFTYNKIKKILKYPNHKIKVIILGFSLHNFSPIYERLFNIDLPEGRVSLNNYLYFIYPYTSNEFLYLSDVFSKYFISAVFNDPEWDGFEESINSNPDTLTIMKTYNMHFSRINDEEMFSSSQKKYLLKIDSLCFEHSIKLVLCSTPYHSDYIKLVNSEYYDYLNHVLFSLRTKLYVNYMLDFPESTWMSDGNHLNRCGAEHYTKLINQRIVQMLNVNEN